MTAPADGPACGGGERTVNRPARMMARMMGASVALLCVFTIGAAAAVAHLLPARLALFRMPWVSGAGLAKPGPALPAATGSQHAGHGGSATAAGVSASLGALITSGNLEIG